MLSLLQDRSSPQKLLWPFTLNVESDQAQGLVGWWPGGPSGGLKLFDLSGKNRHGVLTNFASPFTAASGWVPGKDGGQGALSFSVATDVVVVPTITTGTTFTYSAWVMIRNTSPTNYATLFDDGTGGFYFYRPTNVFTYYFSGTRHDDTNVISRDVLYHFALVNNAGAFTFYVNGRPGGTGTGGPLRNLIRMGASGVGGSDKMDGTIEDTRLYNRAFTVAEVAAIYAPATRWQLRYRLGRTKWFIGSSVATGIQFDAASNSGYQAAASTYSWSHTCTGADRFLSVDVSLLSVPGTTVTGITYNGVALSYIGKKATVTALGTVESWGLANPASGSNTIAVTLSASIISAGTAVSYTAVHQTSPTANYNGAQATNVGAADATVNITTVATGSWVHAAVVTDDGSITAGNTTRNNVTGAGGSGADEDTGGLVAPGSTAMLYSNVAALATWAIGGYEIRPVTASGTAYTGAIGATTGRATAALSATFVKPTYAAALAATAPHATVSIAATFVKPTYTGTLAASTGRATVILSASFTKPTYSGALTAACAPATAAFSATFAKPTYTGALAAACAPATASFSATFTQPTYAGVLTATVGHATAAFTAIAAAAVFQAQLAAITGHATASFSATFTPSTTFTATLAATVGATLASFIGTFTAVAPPAVAIGIIFVEPPRVVAYTEPPRRTFWLESPHGR